MRTITVKGYAERSKAPDTAELFCTVRGEDEAYSAAYNKTEEALAALKNALCAAGNAEKDIKTGMLRMRRKTEYAAGRARNEGIRIRTNAFFALSLQGRSRGKDGCRRRGKRLRRGFFPALYFARREKIAAGTDGGGVREREKAGGDHRARLRRKAGRREGDLLRRGRRARAACGEGFFARRRRFARRSAGEREREHRLGTRLNKNRFVPPAAFCGGRFRTKKAPALSCAGALMFVFFVLVFFFCLHSAV